MSTNRPAADQDGTSLDEERKTQDGPGSQDTPTQAGEPHDDAAPTADK